MWLKALGIAVTTVIPKLINDIYDEAVELISGEAEIKIEKVPDRTKITPAVRKAILKDVKVLRDKNNKWKDITEQMNKKYKLNKSPTVYQRINKG